MKRSGAIGKPGILIKVVDWRIRCYNFENLKIWELVYE